jgi:hypothetical protein
VNEQRPAVPRSGLDARQRRDRWLARAADSVDSYLRSPLFSICLRHGLQTLTRIQTLLSPAPLSGRFQGHLASRAYRFARNTGR